MKKNIVKIFAIGISAVSILSYAKHSEFSTLNVYALDTVVNDINSDGVVNNKDLTRLLKYIAGKDVTVNTDATDVNGDGTVNNKDLTRLLKILAGENVTSDWVLVEDVPEDAEIVNTKWTYTLREYTTNSASSLSGWTKYDTKRTSWGPTQGPLTYDPSNGSRNVWTSNEKTGSVTHYVYYHRHKNGSWSDDANAKSWDRHSGPDVTSPLPNGYYSSLTGQRYLGDPCGICGAKEQWILDYTYEEAIYSTKWYYQEPVYTYYYHRDLSKESTLDPTGQSNVSNVQKWVQYRAK